VAFARRNAQLHAEVMAACARATTVSTAIRACAAARSACDIAVALVKQDDPSNDTAPRSDEPSAKRQKHEKSEPRGGEGGAESVAVLPPAPVHTSNQPAKGGVGEVLVSCGAAETQVAEAISPTFGAPTGSCTTPAKSARSARGLRNSKGDKTKYSDGCLPLPSIPHGWLMQESDEGGAFGGEVATEGEVFGREMLGALALDTSLEWPLFSHADLGGGDVGEADQSPFGRSWSIEV